MLHRLQRYHLNPTTCSLHPSARWPIMPACYHRAAAADARERRRKRCAQTAAALQQNVGAQHHHHQQQHEQLDSVFVYAVSDLHVDHAANLAWVERLPPPPRCARHLNVLLVAGDVSHDLGLIERALRALRQRFDRVVFVAGNHEAWVHAGGGGSSSSSTETGSSSGTGGSGGDSVAKLAAVDRLCRALGVDTAPVRVGPVWLAPMLAWHERAWDTEPDVPGIPPASALTVGDYRKCRWPARVPGAAEHGARALAEWVDALNDGGGGLAGSGAAAAAAAAAAADGPEASLRARSAAAWAELWADLESSSDSSGGSRPQRPDVISLSHFLPLQQLLPEKRFLSYPPLAKAVGSAALAARAARLRPGCHVFGHSHFAWDAQAGAGATRYVQAPLCYPSERARRAKSIRIGAAAAAWRRRREAAIFAALKGQAQEEHEQQALQQEQQEQQQQQQQQQQLYDEPEWVDDLPVLLYAARRAPPETGSGSTINDSSSSPTSSSSSSSSTEWVAEWAPSLEGAWSEYYASNARTPEDTELAPWVAKRYARRLARHAATTSASIDASEDNG